MGRILTVLLLIRVSCYPPPLSSMPVLLEDAWRATCSALAIDAIFNASRVESCSSDGGQLLLHHIGSHSCCVQSCGRKFLVDFWAAQKHAIASLLIVDSGQEHVDIHHWGEGG